MKGLRRSTLAFDKWQKDTLDCTLGQELGNITPAGGGGATAAPSLDFYAKVFASQEKSSALQTAILQQMAAGVTQGAAQKKSSGGRVYDLHNQAAIMG